LGESVAGGVIIADELMGERGVSMEGRPGGKWARAGKGILALAVLTAAASVAAALTAVPKNKGREFAKEARAIINSLAAGNQKDFIRRVSEQGLLVVRRKVDWDKSSKALREPAAPGNKTGDKGYLFLGGLEPLVWEEEEVTFLPEDLKGRAFSRVLKQFQGFARITRENVRGEFYFLDGRDHWYCRPLGTAVEGKLCSSTYWYAYFTREKGEWRVWKLELAEH
jgi:hypothetical protein